MVFQYSFPDVIDLSAPGTVVLPTFTAKVHTPTRTGHVRGILAWASQFNLVSEKCMREFQLPVIARGGPSLHGVGGSAIDILAKSYINFSPRNDPDHIIGLQVHVAKKINKTVSSAKLHPMVREGLEDFELADPAFDEPGDVDLALGVNFCPTVIKEGRYVIPGTSTCIIETIFGWVVTGRAPLENFEIESSPPQNYLCME